MNPSFWSQLGGMFGGMFGQSPYNAANQYMSQIPGYLQPYMNEGSTDLPMLHSQFSQMMQNPSQYLSQIGQNFQADPGYQFQVNQSIDAANKAASAGGMAGSPMQQQQVQTVANQLANQQYQQYLHNALGVAQQGYGGLGGLESQGFGANQTMTDYLAGMAQMSGRNAQNQQNKYSGWGSVLGDILGKFL